MAFICAIPAAALLIVLADGVEARMAAVVYGLGVCALYGVSAAYHRGKWTVPARLRMKRLDHGTIFVMIAASYTPVCLLLVRGAFGTGLLVGVWIGALTGLTMAVTGIIERPYIGFVCYLVLGWVAVIGLPDLLRRGSPLELAMLFAGGLAYTVGAFVLASRWPDPFPRTFGYHEVWHTLVVAASACHYVLILSLLRAG